jgi:hypothetical protein
MKQRTKDLKYKKKAVTDETVQAIRDHFQDECKAQFFIWAESTSLDTGGIWNGEPVFRPAICAWEAWQAAWRLLSSNAELTGRNNVPEI